MTEVYHRNRKMDEVKIDKLKNRPEYFSCQFSTNGNINSNFNFRKKNQMKAAGSGFAQFDEK